MSPVYIVAFSGHRTQQDQPGRSARDLENCRATIYNTLVDLRKRAQAVGGIIHLSVSAAEGADLIACQVAIAEKIPLHLILPLNIEDFKADFSERPEGMHQWSDVEKVISHCESEINNSTFRVGNTSHLRPDCYHETNLQLLDSADILVALWNGESSSSKSGTQSVWKAANTSKLPRIHLNPVDHSSSPDQLDNFATTDGPGLKIITDLLSDAPSPSCDLIQTLGAQLDQNANDHSKNTRVQTRRTIILHGVASFLAAIAISYALTGGPNSPKVLPFIALTEFILIGIAIGIHYRLHHHGEQWIKSRFAAELIRPLHLILPYLDPLKPLIRDHHPEWHRFLLTIGLAQPCNKLPTLQQAKEAYISDRIENQIEHFTSKGDEAAPTATLLYNIMSWSSIVALVVVLIATIYKFSHFNDPTPDLPTSFQAGSFLLYLLPIALPLLSGILLSYRLSFDLGRRKLRYPEMITNLKRARTDLQNAHTPQAFRQVVTRTEEILLDELNEFHTSQRIGLEH